LLVDTLVQLDLDVKHILMNDVCHVLASAPHLRSVRIPVVMIESRRRFLRGRVALWRRSMCDFTMVAVNGTWCALGAM